MMSTKLVQIRLPEDVKEKLDAIFANESTTTPQGLKILATQIANHGYSPLTFYYEQYSRPISNELKQELRQEELKLLGIASNDAQVYPDETSLNQAFKDHLE